MQITTCAEGQKANLCWFPTVPEEETYAIYEAAVPTNKNKTSKFALELSIFTYTV